MAGPDGASAPPRRADFAEVEGARFDLRLDHEVACPLTLTEVRAGADLPGYEQFSLQFLGPADFVLPQRIYPLRHERLGRLNLFLVPVGRDAAGTRYEAVFSLPRP